MKRKLKEMGTGRKRSGLRTMLRRSSSMILASAMVFGNLSFPGGIEAFAGPSDLPYSTELESNTMLMDGRPTSANERSHYYDPSSQRLKSAASYGNGSTTAYKYGYIKANSSGFNGWKFDVNGLIKEVTDEPSAETEEGYAVTDAAGGALSVTYPATDPQGFTTAIGFGSTAPTTLLNLGKNGTKRSEGGTNFYPGKDGEIKNGEVVKVYSGSSNNVDEELEVKLEVKPSPDEKWILLTYTVYNADSDGSNADTVGGAKRADNGRTVWFASGTDIAVAQDDGAPCWATTKTGVGNKIEGIHAVGNNNGSYSLGSFDLLSHHPQMDLGIQKRDASDPSKITTWIGKYTEYSSNYFTDLENISYMPGGSAVALDSGLAYSFKFDLLPGETKSGTMAFSMRGPTYYVDPVNGNDSTGTGFISTPYKTIQKALDKIGTKTAEKVFIFVMNDMDLTSEVVIPPGKSVTIQTTDYVMDSSTNAKVSAYPIQTDADGNRSNMYMIKRDPAFKGDMFKINDNTSTLTFSDIIIDGNSGNTNLSKNNEGTLVRATAGTVKTQSGSVFRNNKVVYRATGETFTDTNGNGRYDAGEPFADANGDGVWSAPTSNTPTLASAIDISGTARLSMNYGEIKNNQSYQGGAVNIRGAVPSGADSSTKFRVANDVMINGNTSEAGGKSNTLLSDGNVVYTTQKLSNSTRIGVSTTDTPADVNDEKVVADWSKSGSIPFSTSNFPADKIPAQWTQAGSGANNDTVVLKATSNIYSISYVDSGNNNVNIAQSTATQKMSGSSINEAPLNLEGQGYIYTGVDITPDNHGLSVTSTGNIIGSMPGADVSVTYNYLRNQGVFKFDPAGGLPAQVPDIVSAVGGAPSGDIPVVTKNGFDFQGWAEYLDTNGNGRYDEGTDTLLNVISALPNPVVFGTKHYVAKWKVGNNQYLLETTYKNNNSNLPLVFKSDVQGYLMMSAAATSPLTFNGYLLQTKTVNPSYGSFDSTGNYSVVMPPENINVVYTYRVDPSYRFTYRVEHKTEGGVLISENVSSKIAEQPLTAAPLTGFGYTLSNAAVTLGNTATPPSLTTDQTNCSFDNDKNFSGYMPNQDVTITYTYSTTAGYFVSQKYTDTTDDRMVHVKAQNFGEGDTINLPYSDVYGYFYQSATANPASLGSFDVSGDFTGRMPAGNASLEYKLDRNPAYWRNISFAVETGSHGTIGTPTSFAFLRDDGSTAADGNAHTFAKIRERGGVPAVTPNPAPYYRFAGWVFG